MIARLKWQREAKLSPCSQAERLVWARKVYGFSVGDWAKIVGVSVGVVQSWEAGKSEPTAEQLEMWDKEILPTLWRYL